MEKNELTFGVEIEFKDASAKKVQKLLQDIGIASVIEGYHNNTNFDTWKICWDGTVSRGSYSNPRNMIGGELVSPILTLNDLGQIDKICSVLKSANANIDRNCGLHIHFSWNGIKEDGAVIKSIVTRYQRFESQIDGFMPRSRRADSNHYCSTLINMNFDSDCARTLSRQSRRQQKVNLTSVYGRTGTIEFRHHSGTANAFKIRNWVLFLADFIVESKNSIGKKEGTAIPSNFDANHEVSASQHRKAFGVMKFALTTLGIEYKQKRGFGFEFINRNPRGGAGDVSVRYSYDRVYAELYTSYNRNTAVGKLSMEGLRTLANTLEVTTSTDNLFDGINEMVACYYKDRTDGFNQERSA